MMENKPKIKEVESTPWKGICSKRCWYAKKDRCRCKCKGQNHKKGYAKSEKTPEKSK
jgi:hypothetical protein